MSKEPYKGFRSLKHYERHAWAWEKCQEFNKILEGGGMAFDNENQMMHLFILRDKEIGYMANEYCFVSCFANGTYDDGTVGMEHKKEVREFFNGIRYVEGKDVHKFKCF